MVTVMVMDIVMVTVTEVDIPRKRIALSMKENPTAAPVRDAKKGSDETNKNSNKETVYLHHEYHAKACIEEQKVSRIPLG